MPRIHPRAEVVQDLVEELAGAERSLLLHVLDCAACRGLLRERLAAKGRPAGPPAKGAAARVLPWRRRGEPGCPVDGVLQRLRGHLQATERELAEAPARLAELLRCPAGRRSALLRAAPRFHTLSLCHQLAAASQEECFREPRAAEELAALGLELAGLLEPRLHGARLLADARLRCWAAVGNARRIAADLRGADRAFAAARELLRAGTRDRLERAHLFALEASLRRAERRLAEADALLRRAIAIYRQTGERHLQGEAILAQALVRHEAGEPEPAIALLQQADRLIDPRRNPRLELCLRHNLAHWLTEAGRYLEARAVIARSRDLYERFPDRPSQLRRLWVEGKVAAGLGLWEEAAGLLERVRDGFAAEPLPYDAALAGLDLAVAWSRLGRIAEVRTLAAEVLPLFRARELQRETLAALLVLERAAAAEGAGIAGIALLEEATARLRAQAAGGRRDPLPFDLSPAWAAGRTAKAWRAAAVAAAASRSGASRRCFSRPLTGRTMGMGCQPKGAPRSPPSPPSTTRPCSTAPVASASGSTARAASRARNSPSSLGSRKRSTLRPWRAVWKCEGTNRMPSRCRRSQTSTVRAAMSGSRPRPGKRWPGRPGRCGVKRPSGFWSSSHSMRSMAISGTVWRSMRTRSSISRARRRPSPHRRRVSPPGLSRSSSRVGWAKPRRRRRSSRPARSRASSMPCGA